MNKYWVVIKVKGSGDMVRIQYNPFNKSIKEVIKECITKDNINKVYGVKVQ